MPSCVTMAMCAGEDGIGRGGSLQQPIFLVVQLYHCTRFGYSTTLSCTAFSPPKPDSQMRLLHPVVVAVQSRPLLEGTRNSVAGTQRSTNSWRQPMLNAGAVSTRGGPCYVSSATVLLFRGMNAEKAFCSDLFFSSKGAPSSILDRNKSHRC